MLGCGSFYPGPSRLCPAQDLTPAVPLIRWTGLCPSGSPEHSAGDWKPAATGPCACDITHLPCSCPEGHAGAASSGSFWRQRAELEPVCVGAHVCGGTCTGGSTCTHMYVRVCPCTHTYVHGSTPMCTRVHHARERVHVCGSVCTCMCTCVDPCVHTRMHMASLMPPGPGFLTLSVKGNLGVCTPARVIKDLNTRLPFVLGPTGAAEPGGWAVVNPPGGRALPLRACPVHTRRVLVLPGLGDT